jgi:3D (Asp-Asp-Asp) domain-containing protein
MMKVMLIVMIGLLLVVNLMELSMHRVFKITAYCEGTITKTGKPVREGFCAVDPKVIPLHSIVTIKGLGTFEAEDTGGKVKGNVCDIFVSDCNKAKEFGVQWREVRWKRHRLKIGSK